MVFLFNINFRDHRLLSSALNSFFGLGPQGVSRLMASHHMHAMTRMRDLGAPQLLELNASLSGMKIENELRRKVLDDIKRLRDCGTYRGRRHAMGLPVRGQRTRNQTKTANRLNRVDRRLGGEL